MTTDGMKRRDFLRTVTTLVGAVALGGSASLLSGCGGNGGSSSPAGPTLTTPTTPGGTSATSAASALTNAGVSGVSSSSVSTTGTTVTGSTSSSAVSSATNALSATAASAPSNAPLAVFVNGQPRTISLATFQGEINTVLSKIAALPAGEGPTIQAGDQVKLITYTLSNGQMYSSPAIVDANGNVVFDMASILTFPSPSDSTHTVTQNVQTGTKAAASTTLFNPVSGLFLFNDVVTGTANSEANGNLNATNPVTNLVVNQPTVGPGVSLNGSYTEGTPVFKAVVPKTRQSGGSNCVVLVFTFSVTITLFGITISTTVTVTFTICSSTGSSGNGV